MNAGDDGYDAVADLENETAETTLPGKMITLVVRTTLGNGNGYFPFGRSLHKVKE